MSRHIQAYFRNEDGAEASKASLVGYRTEHLEIGRLPNGTELGSLNFVPFFPMGTHSGMYSGGNPNAGTYPSAAGIAGIPTAGISGPNGNPDMPDSDRSERNQAEGTSEVESLNQTDPNPPNDLSYVLSATVREDEYNEIVALLQSRGGYVERVD